MTERPRAGDPSSSVQEPEDLARLAGWVQHLLANRMAEEALARFSRLRPPDQADVLAQLPREAQVELLSWLTAKNVGMIIEQLEPPEAVELSQDMEPRQLSQVLDETSPDVAADVLRGLPEDVAASALGQMRRPTT